MRPYPLLRLADENPAPGAQKWRIVAVQVWNTSDAYMTPAEFKFLANPGDAAQPGAGVASASSTYSGASPGLAFDGDPNTNVAIPWNSGSNFLEFDFSLQFDIKEIYYQQRLGGFGYQAPHEASIQAYIGGAWVEKGHLYGIPQWATGEARRYPVSLPADEAGGHRYWRFTPLSTFGATPATEIEVEFLQADNTNIGLRANALPSNPNGQGYNALDGVKTGDNYCNFNGPTFTPLTVDFGYKRVVDHIALTCRSGFLTQAIKEGKLEWSDDNATWNEYMTFHDNSPWTFFTGTSVSGGAGQASNAAQMFQQAGVLVVGQTYNFSIDYNKTAGSKLRIEGLTSGANVAYTSAVLANGAGNISGSFVAGSTAFTIAADTATYSGTIDNVSVTPAGGGANVIQDGTFSTGGTPTSNQTRTFYRKAPVLKTAPLITGDASTYGNLLTADNGTWENGPTSYTKTWKRGATVLAVGDTYTPVVGDNNSIITVETVAHNPVGDSVVATSSTYIGGTQARYWRVRMPYGMRSDGYGSIATLGMRIAAGGTDLAQGKTYLAESQYGSQSANLAFDNNTGTFAAFAITSPAGGHWLRVDFGAPVHIGHVTFTAEAGCGTCCHLGFILEYSSDGTTWATEWDTGPLAAFANGETRTYTMPVPRATTNPAISGDLTNYGNLLTCSDGTWVNGSVSLVKTWKDNTGAVVATGNTYTPTSGQFHTVMTCEVAATNAIGTTTYTISFYVGTRIKGTSIVGGSASSLVVPIPSGAVAGDKMLLFAESAWGVSLPSGWTQHDLQNGSNINGGMFSKVLTSGDITTGSVTISFAGSYGCSAVGVLCNGAPTVAAIGAYRQVPSGTVVTVASALAGDEAIWFGGLRDGPAGAPTISVGTTLISGDYASNQGHSRVNNHPIAANGNEPASLTFASGSAYIGCLLLR